VADRAEHLVRLRRADSNAKAARVLAALDSLVGASKPLAVARVARMAGVSRRFLYDHPELRAEVERRCAELAQQRARSTAGNARVTTASLRADLENAKAANRRLEEDLAALKRRLGELLGDEIMAKEIGEGSLRAELAANARVTELEQALFDAQETLARRTEELEAARQINRELMARLNR